ncbi:phytase [Saprospiraceae bacterium]|nr:phytase [Saprospiraceae bacterium]MDB4769244.1 phytase [Saprospiraceae bacterium]
MTRLIIFLFISTIFIACQSTIEESKTTPQNVDPNIEAREDSLALVAAYEAQRKIKRSVYPIIETKAIHANSTEDAADDPAIWVNPQEPSKSLIYGSNKKGGLAVYNLQGDEVDYYPLGNINNVDIIYNFPFKDSLITVLGCSNRSDQSIDLLKINTDGKLQDIASGALSVDTSLIDDIYGYCFAKDEKTNQFYALINGKNGLLQQFEMKEGKEGIELVHRRSVQFDSQTEGMVADNQYGFLYVGEEGKGIWKMGISPSTGSDKSFVLKSDNSNPNIVYDIEGLSIYEKGEEGYIIASSQGNFSYAVFDRKGDNDYLGSFKIEALKNVDGVEETDGLAIVSDSLSADFPEGIIVLQDGFNYKGKELEPQNFKYVSWIELVDF